MNEKFYHLTEDRQRKIIDAAYKVFAKNTYKKAATAEIAKEGGISKALLFHYFRNKLELYSFLWDKAEQMTKEAKEICKVYETDDFFEILRRGLAAKCMLMRKFYYVSLFSINAFYEEEPAIKAMIEERIRNGTDDAYQTIANIINRNQLRTDVSFESIYSEVIFASEGMMNSWYRSGNMDVDVFEQQYLKMIAHWEQVYQVSHGTEEQEENT